MALPTNPLLDSLARHRPREYTATSLWLSQFFPFQQRWILEPARFAVVNKSRKIGLTMSSAGVATVWGAMFGEMNTIISRGQTEADEVILAARSHARILRDLGSSNAQITRHNTRELVFKSGGRIIALPSTGGRSYSGNVFLDELAHAPHAAEVWKAAAPVALLGHRMRVISTPNGVGNEFHDLWEYATNPERKRPSYLENSAQKWAHHEISIHDARREGFPVDLDACWELAKGDPRVFAQEFECSFLDGELQLIPTEAIDSILMRTPLEDKADTVAYDYYAGLDIGKEVDLTVLFVVRVHRRTGMTDVVHVESIKRTEWHWIDDMVDAAFAKYKMRRLCIDRGGLGMRSADEIKRKHSERRDVDYRRPRVELVDFTLKTKEDLATGLYVNITKRLMTLPGCDAALPPKSRLRADGTLAMVNPAGMWKTLHREIASIQRKITKAGNVVYETPRTSQGHSDHAWAAMLALYARDPIHPLLLKSIPGGKTG